MAKPHWHYSVLVHANGSSPVFGCQHSCCEEKATHSWQRDATAEEVEAELNIQGPYGAVVRNMQGPNRTAVFSCLEHTLPVDAMAMTHTAQCPAPDPGCECEHFQSASLETVEG